MKQLTNNKIVLAVLLFGSISIAQSGNQPSGNNAVSAQDAAQVKAILHHGDESALQNVLIEGDATPDLVELPTDPKKREELDKKLADATKKSKTGWAKLYNSVGKTVENGNISYGFGVNKTILDAFNLALNDKTAWQPAYVGGYFLREDAIIPQETFSPLQFFFGSNFAGDISVQGQQEIDVWRVFKSYWKTINPLSIIWTPLYLPVNGHTLLHKLQPGTMVRFHVPLNIFLGAIHDFPIGDVADVQTKLARVISGEYDVYVFRGDHNKARIRLVAASNREIQGYVKIGLDDAGAKKLLPSGMAKNVIVNILKLNDVGGGQVDYKDVKSIFLGDYTLDLSDCDNPDPSKRTVCNAYDNLFSKALIFKDNRLNTLDFKIADPRNSPERIKALLLSNLTVLNDLADQDEALPKDQRLVERNFLGLDIGHGNEYQHHIGFGPLFKITKDTSYRQHRLTIEGYDGNGSETESNYLFPVWYNHNSNQELGNLFHKDLLQSALMVYKADKIFNPTDFSMMGFYYDLYESRYGDAANRIVINHFHNVLPMEVDIDLGGWLADHGLWYLNDVKHGVLVSGRYFVNNNGVLAAAAQFNGQSSDQIFSTIMNDMARALRATRGVHVLPSATSDRDVQLCTTSLKMKRAALFSDIAGRYCGDLVFIAKKFATIAQLNLKPEIRMEAAGLLVSNNLFRQIGPAFIFSVIPEAAYQKSLFFELMFHLPNNVNPLIYYWPHDKDGNPIVNVDRQLIEQLLDNENTFNNETPDLRLNCTVDNITCRKTRLEGNINSKGPPSADGLVPIN